MRLRVGQKLGSLFGSIRFRLVLVAVIAITPIVLERLRGLDLGRTDRVRMAEQNVLELALHGARTQRDIIESAQTLLETLALSPTVRDGSTSDCNNFLSHVAGKIEAIDLISVISTGSAIICSSEPTSVGTDLSDRRNIQRALSEQRFSVSDYLTSRVLGKPVIVATLPFGGGERHGAIAATIRIESMYRLIAEIGERSKTSVALFDRSGTLIARYPEDNGRPGQNYKSNRAVAAAIQGGSGTLESNGLDGRRQVMSYAAFDNDSGLLVVGADMASLLGKLDRQAVNALYTVAAVSLFVIGVLIIGGWHLVAKPIRALSRQAFALGEGRYDEPAKDLPTELAPLGTALSKAALRLEEREAQLKSANSKLELLVDLDGLTGLRNRRAFDRLLAQTMADLEPTPVSLLMIDVDYFKSFNDTYGHLQGDECLKCVAGILESHAPANAIVARFGGEEFVVLLPNVTIERAFEVGENLRAAVMSLAIPNEGAVAKHVTISVGLCTMTANEAPSSFLIAAADAQLYEAKSRGRNQVAPTRRQISWAA